MCSTRKAETVRHLASQVCPTVFQQINIIYSDVLLISVDNMPILVKIEQLERALSTYIYFHLGTIVEYNLLNIYSGETFLEEASQS
jgi:hypothetical protein